MTSCICKACVLDIKRNSTNPVYRPRWKKVSHHVKYPDALNVKACKIADTATITRVLQLAAGQQQSEDIRLCTDHYNVVYRSLPQKSSLLDHQKCKVCSKFLIKGSNYHHCPLKKISRYLAETTDWNISIGYYYKSHVTILEEEELNSHDSDLITLISEIEREKCTGTLEKCLNLVARKVAEILLRQKAMLLPDVRDMLVNHFQSENHPTTDQVTSKFLFSYLKQRLGKHLACCTRVRSIGTLLYRKGGDLLTTITSIGRGRRLKMK